MAARQSLCLAVGAVGVRLLGTEEPGIVHWPDTGEPDPVARLAKQLRDHLSATANASVTVVLLPCFVDLRQVDLPDVRPREITAILENHSSRYFPQRMSEAAVGWGELEGDRDGQRRVLAAAADGQRLGHLLEAMAGITGNVPEPVVAQEAWVEGARRHPDSAGFEEGVVCVELDDRWVVLEVRRRRLSSSAALLKTSDSSLKERIEAELASGGVAIVIGVARPPAFFSDHEGASKVHVALLSGDPVAMLPELSRHCRWLAVMPRHLREERTRSRRRAKMGRFLAAGLFVLLAFGLDTFRISRDLRAVQELRTRHAAEVESALALRDQVEQVEQWVSSTEDYLAADAPWHERLDRLARAIPPGTQLDHMVGRSGEVELTGTSWDAAAVLSAVRGLEGVAAVDLSRPLRRSTGADGSSEDQFSFAVRLTEFPPNGR